MSAKKPGPKLLWIIGNSGPVRLYLGNNIAKEELVAALDAAPSLSPAFQRFRDLLRSTAMLESEIIEIARLRKLGMLPPEPEEAEAQDG